MEKSLRQAVLVQALLLAASLLFLVAFFRFGLGRDHALLNIALVLLGIVAGGLLLVLLWRRTLEREMLVRRFFVSPTWIYNHEIGFAPLAQVVPDGDVYAFVTFAANALARMSYGFEVAETPDPFEPQFLIDSRVFLFHTSGDADEGVVIDEWQGTLSRMSPAGSTEEPAKLADFEDAGALARLLEAFGAFAEPSAVPGGGC